MIDEEKACRVDEFNNNQKKMREIPSLAMIQNETGDGVTVEALYESYILGRKTMLEEK